MKIITSAKVCLISCMNIDYKENYGNKCFSFKSKALMSWTQWGDHDCGANNKKNGDYYDYPSLSLFMDEH